ncbi:MAG: rhodanese-like domain-containing protein [Clostridiales bacterium]|nr:rhodanese-like domain-containing protein [Clostridiales bacterium]
MKKIIAITIIIMLCLTGCSGNVSNTSATMSQEQLLQYKQISQEEAKEMMNREDGHIIVDVRRRDEYDEGHLPDAILIPNESIDKSRPKELPDLDQIILVYCRSGRRSKEASEKLAAMGYKNVYEFGGIITWTGETVR